MEGRGGGAIRFDITQFSQTPPTKSRGQSTTDVVRASWRSQGADNLPEGPLKSRTVVMRDERVGRCPAVSGLTQPWLEHCLFYSPEFANLEEDIRNRINRVSQSGGMAGVPKPSLDVSVSQKGRTRRAGLQNVGKHCSGTGRNLFGSALNLDRAGVQSPDTPGLTGHVQTVLVTCRHVLGRGRGCPQGGNTPSSHYLLPGVFLHIRELMLDGPKGSAPATLAIVSQQFPARPPVAVSGNVVVLPLCRQVLVGRHPLRSRARWAPRHSCQGPNLFRGTYRAEAEHGSLGGVLGQSGTSPGVGRRGGGEGVGRDVLGSRENDLSTDGVHRWAPSVAGGHRYDPSVTICRCPLMGPCPLGGSPCPLGGW